MAKQARRGSGKANGGKSGSKASAKPAKPPAPALKTAKAAANSASAATKPPAVAPKPTKSGAKPVRKASDADLRRARERGRGRTAEHPLEIPALGWQDAFWRIWQSVFEDRILLIAAGATFYLLLALFPALAAFVSLYGFVSDPITVADQASFMAGMLPTASIELLQGQLKALSEQRTDALSLSFVFGLLIALWSANNGIKALFDAMNVAYREPETRSFLKLNLISFAFTLSALAIGIAMITAIGVVPAALSYMQLDGWTETIVRLARWPAIFVFAFVGIVLIQRYGPDRERAKLPWLTIGALVATVGWLLVSVVFSFYLERFGNYNATYGALGAVVGFMMWTWISCIVLILGAEVNAELEHQTARDTTTGKPLPLGERGARMADTVGVAATSPK